MLGSDNRSRRRASRRDRLRLTHTPGPGHHYPSKPGDLAQTLHLLGIKRAKLPAGRPTEQRCLLGGGKSTAFH